MAASTYALPMASARTRSRAKMFLALEKVRLGRRDRNDIEFIHVIWWTQLEASASGLCMPFQHGFCGIYTQESILFPYRLFSRFVLLPTSADASESHKCS